MKKKVIVALTAVFFCTLSLSATIVNATMKVQDEGWTLYETNYGTFKCMKPGHNSCI